jgi:cyclase
MLLTRVMPCLLLRDGALVKTVRFRNAVYVGDPLNAMRIYNEKEVDELILVDIGATHGGTGIPFRTIEEAAGECFMPLCYGGGVRRIEDIREVFRLGAEKVAINTAAVEDPELVRRAADTFGSQSIIVSIDVKKGLLGKWSVYTRGGRKNAHLDPIAFACRMEEMGAGEILLTSMDRDGTWQGYDLDLIRAVSGAVGIPTIACGGAGTVTDFSLAVGAGASAVAAGSMVVFQGKDLGVLVKFPTRAELDRVLAREPGAAGPLSGG